MLRLFFLLCFIAGSILAIPDTVAITEKETFENNFKKIQVEASGQDFERTETPEILVVDQGPNGLPQIIVLPSKVSAAEDAAIEEIILASDGRDIPRVKPTVFFENKISGFDEEYHAPTEGVAVNGFTIHPVTRPESNAPIMTEFSNNTKKSICKTSTICYADNECGEEGHCLGLFVGKCNCNACLNLNACSNDSECGGLNGACAENKQCDCITGFKANGFPTFIDALRGLCNNKNCDGKIDTCFGLPCTSGRCVC